MVVMKVNKIKDEDDEWNGDAEDGNDDGGNDTHHQDYRRSKQFGRPDSRNWHNDRSMKQSLCWFKVEFQTGKYLEKRLGEESKKKVSVAKGSPYVT